MTTDLKIIKPSIGKDVYHWEDSDDVLSMLRSLKFRKGYRAMLKVDYNEGLYFSKEDLTEAWKAFTEK